MSDEKHPLRPAGVAAIIIAVGAVAAVVVDRGPYVQNGAPNAITIMWRTDVITTGRAWYGTNPGNLDAIETEYSISGTLISIDIGIILSDALNFRLNGDLLSVLTNR